MKIKAIIFDIDDTIFDREIAQNKVISLIYKKNKNIFKGIKFKEIKIAFLQSGNIADKKYKTDNNIEHFRKGRAKIFLDLLNIDNQYIELIKNTYLEYYPKMKAEKINIVNLFKKIAKSFKIGIISNGFSDVQYVKLETLKIKKYCDCIILSGELGIEKPNKEIFLKACDILNIKPYEAIYFGDSYESDVIGAKKAGLKVIWLNEKRKEYNYKIKPDWEIVNLNSINTILKKLHNGVQQSI